MLLFSSSTYGKLVGTQKLTKHQSKSPTHPKFNSLPLKSYRAPIGKDDIFLCHHFSGENELLNFGGVHLPYIRWLRKIQVLQIRVFCFLQDAKMYSNRAAALTKLLASATEQSSSNG